VLIVESEYNTNVSDVESSEETIEIFVVESEDIPDAIPLEKGDITDDPVDE